MSAITRTQRYEFFGIVPAVHRVKVFYVFFTLCKVHLQLL